MKKLTFVFSLICLVASASLATPIPNGAKSSGQHARKAKAKCEAMSDEAKKADCLKALEEKAAKKHSSEGKK